MGLRYANVEGVLTRVDPVLVMRRALEAPGGEAALVDFANRVDTSASILTQAGTRWEGDVALSLENINDYGLIEIYETVMNRGRMLSVDAGINYGPANDALLLVAGYLSDLYMMLGNEAWADASNPTIGIGSGPDCDGQILVTLDLIGAFPWFTPKFVKPRIQTGEQIRRAAAEWKQSLNAAAS